ncbi:MFS transporter [Actinomadura macrotermitis]|uniref:Putative multidrug-efflux transporter n=1 Tax=Actinomadura macrotermitis TaxID=2585200 RepID=A0A7K0BWJ0_9ACTN|nr:MFS transporter [Actinomadura macrotermitis]MQY05545.1 putative multidrug-efflux transporter [Actinomadura macrotermitis]
MSPHDHEQPGGAETAVERPAASSRTATGPGSPPAWRELLGREHLGAAIVLAGGVLVGAINIYLAASLLPTAVADLGGADFYAWNMTVYLVAMVVATMLTGRFLSRCGNVGAYLLGFAAFTAGSLACAVSPAMVVLLVSRGVQGLGAGLLSGLGFAVIRAALPARLWTRGAALMSAMYGVGNFAGPAIGGLFAQFGSWRLAFAAMAVLGAGCGAIVPRVLPRSERGGRVPIPAVSLLLLTAGAGAVSVAGVVDGTPAKAACIGVALLLVAGFAVHERRSELRVFPRTTYQRGSSLKWVYLTLGLLAFGVAAESFLPLFGQRLAGLPPLVAGFFAAAISLGWSVTQLRSSSVTGRRAVRRLRVLGPLLLAAGLIVQGLLQREDTPVWLVLVWVPVLFAAGAGIGLAYPHLSVAAMSSTDDPEEGGRAAAGIATVTSLAIAFGTALAGVLVNLGGSMLDAARYTLFGLAAVCAVGALTAHAANRRSRTEPADQVPPRRE